MEPLPPTYAELARWYPQLTDRARVLGLSRQTLTAWERIPAPSGCAVAPQRASISSRR